MAKTINIHLCGEKTQASGILSFSMEHQVIHHSKIKQFQTRDVFIFSRECYYIFFISVCGAAMLLSWCLFFVM
jgi:hypothetical protein